MRPGAYPVGLLMILVLSLSACANETPYLDSRFGQPTAQAQSTQAVTANRADPAMRMDARALHNGMWNYMGDRPAPQAIQGMLSGSGGSSGQ